MDVDAERDARRSVRELLTQNGVVEVAPPGAARLLREAEAQVAEPAELRKELDGETLLRVRVDAATGTSVYVDSSGTQNPFVSHTEIVNAVTTLGYTGSASDVDLDALMVRNVGTREEFEIGDEILFSIRAVSQANFDGGEIIRLPAGGAPSFLSHGGHDWDTAFATAAAFDSQSEDVDAIEATPTLAAVPMLTAWWVPALAAMMGAMGVLQLRSVLARNPAESQR